MVIVISVTSVLFVLGGALIIGQCRPDEPNLPTTLFPNVSSAAWINHRYWLAIVGVALAVSGIVAFRLQVWWVLLIGAVVAGCAFQVLRSKLSNTIE